MLSEAKFCIINGYTRTIQIHSALIIGLYDTRALNMIVEYINHSEIEHKMLSEPKCSLLTFK